MSPHIQSLHEIDDPQRLAAVHRLDLLDTQPEPEFDELVRFAATVCEVPIGIISLVDDHREWYISALGVPQRELPLELTFCRHTITQTDLLLVEDTLQDPRFANHPAVTGDPAVRFYAGISVLSPDGFPVGTLCIADLAPRSLSPLQLDFLRLLAQQINARLQIRQQRIDLTLALHNTQQANVRLSAQQHLFQDFMDSAPFMTFLKDAEGRFIFYNGLMRQRFGISPTEWIGLSVHDVFPKEAADEYRGNDLDVIRSGTLHVMDEVALQPHGTPVTWRSYKFPCTAEDGSILLGGISIDMTEELNRQNQLQRYQAQLEEANAKLSELATTDALTGLPNRRAFDDRLTSAFASARHSMHPLSVILLDVDNFKQHNDRFGHDAGDDTLRQVAKLLRQASRVHELVARYGGEEFIVLLPDTNESQAGELAERILKLIRTTAWPLEPITASAGIACLAPTTPTETHIVTLADEALYAAKRSGKDCFIAYNSYFNQVS